MTTADFTLAPRRITGRTVLFGLIAFFALVATVNGVFIYFAITSWPGLSNRDAYKDGLNYNAQLDEARRQQALGWTSRLGIDSSGGVVANIGHADRTPVSGLRVQISITRPVGDERRVDTDLAQALDGSYRGAISALDAGQWRVQLTARRGGQTVYRMNHDLWVRP